MAAQNLTALSAPAFPQVFDALLDRLIAIAARAASPAYDFSHDLSAPFTEANLPTCAHEDDFAICKRVGVVQPIGSDFVFCLDHFCQGVRRG